MRKLFLLATMIGALSASSAGAQVVIMDQIGTDPATLGTAINASQRFADFPAFDIGVGDNFTVPAGPGVTLTQVQAVFNGFSGFVNANYTNGVLTQWSVEIYSSTAAATANLTGNVASFSAAFNAPSVNVTPYGSVAPGQSLVTLDVSSASITLAPGSYFVAVIPSMPFGTGGQLGVVNNATFGGFPNDGNAWQANPGGGFAIPGNFQSINNNSAYRIVGTPVPEPTSMALVGIGAVGFALRRWRKK